LETVNVAVAGIQPFMLWLENREPKWCPVVSIAGRLLVDADTYWQWISMGRKHAVVIKGKIWNRGTIRHQLLSLWPSVIHAAGFVY
jgi:hypothetical protein